MNYKYTIENFCKFIIDRQSVYHKKNVLGLDKPWTQDPVLQSFRFCNVFRSLDKVSLKVIKFLQMKNTPEDKLLNLFVLRHFNKYDTFEKVLRGKGLKLKTFDLEKEIKYSDKLFEEGYQFYNSAYMVARIPFLRDHRREKRIQCLYIVDHLKKTGLLKEVMNNLQKDMTSEQRLEEISRIPMVAGFLGGQLLSDLTYCGDVPFTVNDFLFVGPGAVATIDRLSDSPSQSQSQEEYVQKFEPIFEQVNNYLKNSKEWQGVKLKEINVIYPEGVEISRMDLQNCMCEWRKYCNLRDNNKRVKKRVYDGQLELQFS